MTVANVDETPIFTSTVEVEVAAQDPEGEPLTAEISGGLDAGQFGITGNQLVFTAPPDYEAPADEDAGNFYAVQLTARDPAGNATTQDLSVTVTDVDEPIDPPPAAEATAHLDFIV